MSGLVMAAHPWRTNADLIADCARLGYLADDDRVLDPTYGKGSWWAEWRPADLVASDLDPNKSPGPPVDFRDLPHPDGAFDAAVFDPPYMAPGGRDGTSIDAFNDSYGLHTTPATPRENQELIDAGLREVGRVVKPRGVVLVKCMDYVNSGKLFPGTHLTLTAAIDGGFELVDRLEHLRSPGPQPARDRQVHARRNLSTLFVLRTPRSAEAQGALL